MQKKMQPLVAATKQLTDIQIFLNQSKDAKLKRGAHKIGEALIWINKHVHEERQKSLSSPIESAIKKTQQAQQAQPPVQNQSLKAAAQKLPPRNPLSAPTPSTVEPGAKKRTRPPAQPPQPQKPAGLSFSDLGGAKPSGPRL